MERATEDGRKEKIVESRGLNLSGTSTVVKLPHQRHRDKAWRKVRNDMERKFSSTWLVTKRNFSG